MNRAIAPLAALALLALAACAGPTDAPAGGQAAAGVTRTEEPGGKFAAFVGPRRQHAEAFLGVPGTNFFALRSWLDTNSGEIAHQLYVEDSYFGAKRGWEAARDAAGQKLRFIPIASNEITCDSGCSYAEEFAVALPEALLRANPQGLSVIITAHSGTEQKIAVPGELIAQQLAAIDKARPAGPTVAGSAPGAR